MQHLFFAFGSGFALIAVVTGAFAAHALKSRLSPEMFQIFEVAVRYQMYHALGLDRRGVGFYPVEQPADYRLRLVVCGWYRHFFGQPLHPITNRRPLARRDYTDRWSRLYHRLGLSPLGGNQKLRECLKVVGIFRMP